MGWFIKRKRDGYEYYNNPSNYDETFNYDFPENESSEDEKYEVKYVSQDGCTATTEVTVKSCETPPPTPVVTCRLYVDVTSEDEGYISCEAGSYDLPFEYSAFTSTDGVEVLTESGEGNGTVVVGSGGENCSSEDDRYINITNIDNPDIVLTSIIPYGGGKNILDKYSDCEINDCYIIQSGGGSDPNIIKSCNDITFKSDIFYNAQGVYVWDGTGSIRKEKNFGNIQPMFRGNVCECEGDAKLEFVINCTNPYYGEDGNWWINCDCYETPGPQQGCQKGTSGTTTETGAEIFGVGIQGTTLVKETGECYLAAYNITPNSVGLYYGDNRNGMVFNNCCPPKTATCEDKVGISLTMEFNIYKNQETKTGETIKCRFEIYADLNESK